MTRRRVNACHVPAPTTPLLSDIYRGFRDHLIKTHCDAKRGPHACCGTISIDRKTVTLNCRLCGDLRKLLVEGKAEQDANLHLAPKE